jgi:heme-degrading monooxygenase HmoA
MFMEIVQFPVKAGQEEEFEKTVSGLMPRFKSLKGFQGYELRRSVEAPSRYYLMVRWEKLEDHTVGYAQSDLRPVVGAAFAAFADGRPMVEHGKLVAS